AQGDAKIELRTRIARKVTIAKRLYRLALDLHVIDNGPGIPEEIRDRIFYPLVSGREDGSGLGLTLAQVASVLDGDARGLDAALAAHEAALD
uniref:ATP-binding protein n=1 Tax=Listeria monocytogenes TaxID=1639 RepID=UPI003F6683F0